MPQENLKPIEPNDYPGYWHGKTPCWVMLGCSKYAYQRCAAYLHPETPCWEHKLTCSEEILRISKDCQHCIVYKVYHSQDS